MDKEYTMIRISKDMHKVLKMYAADKGMTMQNALEQLIERYANNEERHNKIV